ncbi:hypothetical protein [Pelagibacterium sp.]|uniref:hypothetical protein n=1 Tax=Pelagibacterium sp. TaxID=1967288 RepID=UPI003BAB484D
MLKSFFRFLTEPEPQSVTRQSGPETLDHLDLHTLADLPAYHPSRETNSPMAAHDRTPTDC